MRAMLLTGHGGLDKLVYREDCLAVLLGLDPSIHRCRGARKPKKVKAVTRIDREPSARLERSGHIAIEGTAERRLPFAQGNIVREMAPSTP